MVQEYSLDILQSQEPLMHRNYMDRAMVPMFHLVRKSVVKVETNMEITPSTHSTKEWKKKTNKNKLTKLN